MGIEKRSLNSVFTPLFTTRRQRHSAAAHYDSIRTYILLLLDTHIFLTRIQTASSQQELASRRKLARPRIASTGRSWPSKEKPRAASMSRYPLLDSTPASLHRCTWYTETHTRGTLHRLYFIRYLSLSRSVCVPISGDDGATTWTDGRNADSRYGRRMRRSGRHATEQRGVASFGAAACYPPLPPPNERARCPPPPPPTAPQARAVL